MGRIVFVSSMAGSPWGGSEELWTRTADALLKRGHEVGASVQSWTNESPRIGALEQSGCAIYRRRYVGRLQRILQRFPLTEQEWLQRRRPELVVISQGAHIDGLPWMEMCRSMAIPYAPLAHANSESLWPKSDTHRARLAEHYEAAVESYFVSQRNLELARVQFAADLTRASVVRNPVNVPYDVAVPWPDADTGYRLACVARFEPGAKGHDILFEVFAQDKWRQRPVTVDLYGAGPLSDSLALMLARANIPNVKICGHLSDVSEIWRRHHGLVLASRFEGLPLVVVEAMLCARPCFVTDVGGSAELLADGVSGILAAAPTAKAFDAALERAWQVRDRWQQMGEAAARDVRRVLPADPIAEFAATLEKHLSR